MRKDVRLGAVIGGLLIAVLVVSSVVSSRNKGKKAVAPVALESSGPAADAPADHAAPADGAAPAAEGASAEAPAAPAAPGSPVGPVSAEPAPAAPAPASPAPADPVRHGADWATRLSADGDVNLTRTPDPALPADVAPGSIRFASETRVGHPRHLAGGSDDASSSAAAGSAPHTYTVKSGDTFSSIARAVYGDGRFYRQIMKANPTVNPTRLRAGAVINLPDRTHLKSTAADASTDGGAAHDAPRPVANPDREYRVRSNDSLYKISMKLYHTPNKIDAIYQLNKSTIGPDPEKLKLDMLLKLPEPPATN